MATSKPKSVVLVSPNGVETEVTSPTSFNNLVYGHGAKPKTGNIHDAYEGLLANADDSAKPASTVEKKAGT